MKAAGARLAEHPGQGNSALIERKHQQAGNDHRDQNLGQGAAHERFGGYGRSRSEPPED